MKSIAVGFRAHSRWTTLVALALTKGVPWVVARQRLQLVETFTYEFRQPFHTGEKMRLNEARAFISRARKQARRLALRAIGRLHADLEEQGYLLDPCGLLLASGRPLPGLSKILASHSLIHSADGELFRRSLLEASARRGLRAVTIRERELLDSASRILRMKPN